MRCLLLLAATANITVITQWPQKTELINDQLQIFHSLVFFSNITNFTYTEHLCNKIRVRLYRNQKDFVKVPQWKFVYATGICQCSFQIKQPSVYSVVYTFRKAHIQTFRLNLQRAVKYTP